MSDKKLFYKTPDVRVVGWAVTESFLASSAESRLEDVKEEELDFIF